MESTQSVHGRITYRRVASVIDAKIKDLDYARKNYRYEPDTYEMLGFAIETLESLRGELEGRNATHYWPSPL